MRVGMSRTDETLSLAAEQLAELGPVIGTTGDSAEKLEVANLVTVATLITHAAWLRTESRGCHFRRDHPERDEQWRVRIVQMRGTAPSLTSVGGHTMSWARSGGLPHSRGAVTTDAQTSPPDPGAPPTC
jgi:succinate dehydrogenase/fumarate reductase flavoprotein subunit